MNHFLIVDGSSILTTNYYATLPKNILFAKTEEEKQKHYKEILQTKDGIYTNGIYGTLRLLYQLITKIKPTHLAFVFDQSRDTFRRGIYPEYKANRKETPKPLKEQFIMTEKMLPWLGIPTFYSEEYEADDYAGSLAKRFASKDTRVSLLTKDKDYLQLVNEYTNCWLYQSTEKTEALYESYYYPLGYTKENIPLPNHVFSFTPSYVEAEYGVKPKQIIDMKALGGDNSDNIPGVKGVSEKTAVQLLSEYETVEDLYEALHEIDTNNKTEVKAFNQFLKELGINRSPLNALLKKGEYQGENAALLSKKLATIYCDIPFTQGIDDFKTNVDMERFEKTCQRLEIKTIV